MDPDTIICVLFQCSNLIDSAHKCFSAFIHDRNPNNIPTLYVCEVEIAAEGLTGVQQLLSNPVGQNVKFVFAAVRTEP